MNLLYDDYPESVKLYGATRRIVTDFKDWLRFVDMLRDDDLRLEEKESLMMSMYLDSVPQNQWEGAYEPLLEFFQMDNAGKKSTEPDDGVGRAEKVKPLYDFAYDAPYIIAGFWQDYKIDLTEANMHWWKFRILLDGLSSETEFKQRVMYRGTNAGDIKDSKERQRIQRIQRAIAIPQATPSDDEIGDVFW